MGSRKEFPSKKSSEGFVIQHRNDTLLVWAGVVDLMNSSVHHDKHNELMNHAKFSEGERSSAKTCDPQGSRSHAFPTLLLFNFLCVINLIDFTIFSKLLVITVLYFDLRWSTSVKKCFSKKRGEKGSSVSVFQNNAWYQTYTYFTYLNDIVGTGFLLGRKWVIFLLTLYWS